MAVNQLVLIGDSLTQGTTGSVGYQAGGQGSFAQLVTDRLANIGGLGPLVSTGCRSCNSAQGDWSFTTGGDAWTDTVGTDAWDKALYGSTSNGSIQLLRYASGATKVATWTAGAAIRYPNVGFCIYWMDYASGSSSTPSYSTDGGSTWTNFPDTPARNNTIRKFYVATPVAPGSTVKIQAANASNTAVGTAPMGIEIFYQSPSTAQGLIVHNVAVGGSDLHHLVATSSGDRMAWFDSVVVGTGAIANTPNLGVIHENVNDISEIGSDTTWATDLTTFWNRVHPLGPVGFLNMYELNPGLYDTGQQTSYRAKTKTTAAAFATPAPVLDIYDQWSALGITGNAAANTAGFLFDLTHESQAGHIDIATRVYWWLRAKFLSSYAGSTSYTAQGKQAAVAYLGKTATVAYSAGQQIAPLPV